MNTAYSQSAMGWLNDSQSSSDLSRGYYGNRYWSKPHLVTYMESHDEPWLMYKNLQYGRSSGSYDIKDLDTALDRIKLVAAFFLTFPGPKMLWQFGELGYDQHLPNSGLERTAPKPILWEYYDQPNRKDLFNTIASLIKIRKENKAFRNPQYVQMRVGQGQYDRRINIYDDIMNVTIIGNFNVTELSINPSFQHTGEWYDYFSRDTLFVTNIQEPISLAPGEFRIYTDVKLGAPVSVAAEPKMFSNTFELNQNYPNPFNPYTVIKYSLPHENNVMLKIYNVMGQEVKTLINKKQYAGRYSIEWDGTNDSGELVSSGLYFYEIRTGQFTQMKKMLLIR